MDEDDGAWFLNFYECPRCGHTWEDEWSCMVDDDCPECDCRHISPVRSEDAEQPEFLDLSDG